MNYWGRIFFNYGENGVPKWVYGQPLENHNGNCAVILEHFSSSLFHEETKERLLKAADIHDFGKKETFKLFDKKEGGFRYSFSGHRFRVPGIDPYIDALIRSHHEYSVEQINREKSRLSAQEKNTFADDLYLLCMADQLEAELAVKTVENKSGSPRTFMEFVTLKSKKIPTNYSVQPWPFSVQSFSLHFNLKKLKSDIIKKKKLKAKELEKALKESTDFKEKTITIKIVENLDED